MQLHIIPHHLHKHIDMSHWYNKPTNTQCT
jgi:hypothetical protein